MDVTIVAKMLREMSVDFANRFGLDLNKVDAFLDQECDKKINVPPERDVSADAKKVLDLFNKLNREYLDSEYTFRWDKCKARFGVCRYKKKEISLSGPLFHLHPVEQMLNTVKHEVAHACDYKYNGKSSMHGKPWKEWAIKLGAVPKACTKTNIVDKTGRWLLRNVETGEVYRSYTRQPKRVGQLGNSYIAGKKKETMGKLEVVDNARVQPVNITGSKWILRNTDTGEVYRGYSRKPKQIGHLGKDMYVTTKKGETKGKLEIVKN